MPGSRFQQTAQQQQERGLPGSRRAEQRRGRPGRQLEVHVHDARHGAAGDLIGIRRGARRRCAARPHWRCSPLLGLTTYDPRRRSLPQPELRNRRGGALRRRARRQTARRPSPAAALSPAATGSSVSRPARLSSGRAIAPSSASASAFMVSGSGSMGCPRAAIACAILTGDGGSRPRRLSAPVLASRSRGGPSKVTAPSARAMTTCRPAAAHPSPAM